MMKLLLIFSKQMTTYYVQSVPQCKSIIMPDPDQDLTIAMIMMMIFSLTDRMTVSRNFRTITTFYSPSDFFQLFGDDEKELYDDERGDVQY